MKKKVYYKLNRYQVTKVEVETAEQEQAVKMLNRDTDRFAKSEDTYRERYASLDEMYSGKFALTDILVCGECGSPYRRKTYSRNGENKRVWRCLSRLEHGTEFCSDSITVDDETLKKLSSEVSVK